MCGIIGKVHFTKSVSSSLSITSIAHRGPDGSGEWTSESGKVYLGHTRLAILDLSPAGHQPMRDASGRYHITFNGEIYNHLALRKNLPHFNWRGTSDTETLLELFALRGPAILPELKGMFAFAIHDALDDSIFLVRDRLGIKPLWYRLDETAFSFASEVRALVYGEAAELTKEALSEYVAYGRMPGRGKILNGIQRIEPGGWARVMPNKQVRFEKWWPTATSASRPESDSAQIKARIHKLVSQAVEEHLISDVGVGAFLSGGIDSSIITLIAGQKIGKDLKTFTVGFPQSSHDERAVARLVAKKAGTDHDELEIAEDDSLAWVVEAVNKLDLPSVDAINTYIVSKAVRAKGLKVAMSGLGGDELFGGYPSFKSVPVLKWLAAIPAELRMHVIQMMPSSIRQKLSGLPAYSPLQLTLARRRFVSVGVLESVGLPDGTPEIIQPAENLDTMAQISWAEIQGYMIPMLLRDSDQMSMATGLEIRVPFLDHVLVEEVLRIPEKYKKGRGVKPLLVDAFRNELPPEVYQKKKQGFELPMDTWIRKPLAVFTREGVQAAADFFALNEPLVQLTNFEKGKTHWSRVWSWSILGHWMSARNAHQRISHEKSHAFLS